jgi:FkbM family methyltransferase
MTNYYTLSRRLQNARRELRLMVAPGGNTAGVTRIASASSPLLAGKGKTLLLTPNEVNEHHGTGVLLRRLCDVSSTVNLRSHEDYPDKGPFDSIVIKADKRSRAEVFAMVVDAVSSLPLQRILCVPYYPEDYQIAIAAKSILGIPLVVWVMDDNHIHNGRVPKALALELFDLADIRFVISAEMRDAYEAKFQRKFYVLPPTVKGELIDAAPQADFRANLEKKTCAMVGNIWGPSWFRHLLRMIKDSGWTVHWFGRGSSAEWLDTTPEELRDHGIIERGFVPEAQLASTLAAYPFVIVPTGTGDDQDDRKNVTVLSLPTRMPYLMVAARAPMLVVGAAGSCSAGFLARFGVGLDCAYNEEAFTVAVAKMGDSDFNAECRKNAAANANIFRDASLSDWIWQSCAEGIAADDRFERPFRRKIGSFVPFLDDPPPEDLYGDFKEVYKIMHRLKKSGYRPDFIFDVGASSGVWSDTVRRVFPAARSILVEPLPDHYPKWYHKKNPDFEWVQAAASNQNGKATFQVSNDLYGSSLLNPQDNRTYESVEVAVKTLNSILAQKKVTGRGVLKIDVQFAEHLVLEGATDLLKQVDFLILELTLKRCIPEARTFLELVNQMEAAGFHYLDDLGGWRCPIRGTLEQKDVIFASARAVQEFGL